MPRDLAALIKGDAEDNVTTTAPAPAKPEGIMFGEAAANNSKRDDVHPYTQTLTLSDVDSCVTLEDLAFPPYERASRAKVSLSYLVSSLSHLSLCCFPSTSAHHHLNPCLIPLSLSLSVTCRCHSDSCMRWPFLPSAVHAWPKVGPNQYPPRIRT